MWLIFAVALAVKLLLLSKQGIVVENNILKLLPIEKQDKQIEKAFIQFSAKHMQRMFFLVSHQEKTLALKATEELISTLNESQWINEVTSGVSSKELNSIAQLTFQYRNHLLSQADKLALTNENYETFSDFVLQQLYSPLSGGLVELIRHDPLLQSYRFNAAQSQRNTQELALEQGFLSLEKNGAYYYFVTAELTGSAFSPITQKNIVDSISQLEANWENAASHVRLYRAGAIFYAHHGYETARGEISTIGVGSLLLVVSLVLLTFRSITPLLLVVTSISVGILTGLAVVHQAFGEVHLITLVFGASLIGVAVDYSFHYLASVNLSDNFVRLNKIFPAITLGLLSSVLGYLALFNTPFPGLRQMAIFSLCGLIAAYLTVVLLFPYVPLKNRISSRIITFCQLLVMAGQSRLAINGWKFFAVTPLLAIALLFFGASEKENIRQFQNTNTKLESEQATIQEVLQTPAANQFFLVSANTEEELLQNMENVGEQLDALVNNGSIEGYQSIHQWLPSIRSQKNNYQLYKKLYQSSALDKIVESGIITPQEATQFETKLLNDKDNYWQLNSWLSSPQGKRMSHLWLGKTGESYAAIIALNNINKLENLTDLNEQVIFVDKVLKISQIFQLYKEKASVLLLVTCILILGLLTFRYGIKKACIVLSSPVIAISFTLICLTVLSIPITLFNTLALFLVLGIGVDYGLFFAEGKKVSATILLAVILSALTTLFSFGLLALSETPAIYAFGLTMFFGIGTALLLAPVMGSFILRLGKPSL